ncbi:UDP-glucosyltransferase 2-like [Vanessa cardui]|uniref:UDP-glucosyltransferase 2-like n=1 Tax=Vanessa cardui TaxID=171605 RepID=UPI001F136D62|nr:UDP-glucosyltransferase 2-like [Vanessa cardui]
MFSSKIIFILLIITKCDSARILALFPFPSISHQVVFRPLTQELAKRGHEVIVLTTDPAFPKGKSPENLYEMDFHDLSYNTWKEFYAIATGNKGDFIDQVECVLTKNAKVIEEQILSEEMQNIINNKNITFDLLIIELLSRPALAYSHIYKVPVIQISSFGGTTEIFDSMGVLSHANLHPVSARQRILNLSIWENMLELYLYHSIHQLVFDKENDENEMLKKVVDPNIPPVSELRKNVQMVLLNIDPVWDFNRPITKNFVYINGIHHKPRKELTTDLKSYLDNSKYGVVYVSFGTNSKPSSLPPEKIQILMNVFSQLKYDILLKWDTEDLPNCPKNVRVGIWFPQSDLLNHPNVKAFVTQAGIQSTDEAIVAGVPLIGIPLLGDQWLNSENYELNKIGKNLDMETLTEEILRNAIEAVINDPSYRNNIIELRSISRDQPYTPLQRAVWWTEYVLRHGGEHLRSAAAGMHWAEYYELDLFVIILCVTLLFIIIVSCHPNIKAFVTQAGIQSTDEAIDAGVPLVGIPLFGDQWLNSEKYELHKIGIKLDMETLTEETFRNAIDTVISDPSYRNNIIELRSISRDQPYTPLQRAVWWTEYVLRHGGEHLRSAAAGMHWAEYYELDLVVIIFIRVIIVKM